MMGKTMILLVSDQPMPNLLAAIHRPLDVREVVLIESQGKAQQAERLAQVLSARGLGVRRERLDNAYDPVPCQKLVRELVGAAPEQFIVNVTCGTKVMAMGAYHAAVDARVRDILYIELAEGKARWLSSGSQLDNRLEFIPEAEPKLDVDEVLLVHGFEPNKSQDPPDPWVTFASKLAAEASKEAVFALNRLTQAALDKERGFKKKPLPVELAKDELEEARRWLVEAQKADLCNYSQDRVTFASTTPCKMVGGGWLELAAWNAMRRVGPCFGLSTLRTGVVVEGQGSVKNEIDVLALTGRTPYVIECKTARLSGPDAEVKADATFYKLDHLRRLGGLRTQLSFISLDPVPEGQRERFAERHIHIIDGEAIRDLEGELARWLEADKGVTA